MDAWRRRAGAEDGDESFAWFFMSEFPQVVRLLTVVMAEPADAEDAAQEAFVRLHRHWERISRYESPEAWVRRVALNRAFSWRRRESRRRESEGRVPAWVVRSDREVWDDDADRVVRAVRRLRPRDRALIGLYHLEDRPLDEVAGVLGLSPNAAKVALHRSRKRLEELLRDPADEEVVG